MITKYFLLSSYEYPHTYLLFSGELKNIISISKGIYKYAFANCDIIETQETIDEYVNNCTFDIKVNKRKIINLDITKVEDLGIQKRNLFHKRYNNYSFICYNKFVFDTLQEAILALHEASNIILKDIKNAEKETLNRIQLIETLHANSI